VEIGKKLLLWMSRLFNNGAMTRIQMFFNSICSASLKF
jgi:hypothetical protein